MPGYEGIRAEIRWGISCGIRGVLVVGVRGVLMPGYEGISAFKSMLLLFVCYRIDRISDVVVP